MIISSVLYGLFLLVCGCFGYLVTAFLTWVIFSCFGWTWSWIVALGIYVGILLVRWILA